MSAYTSMLSSRRLRPSSVPDRSVLTESESDRGRVLFSPAFRRLQQKAQVFSMEPNAAVRSRLTHSLEVSQLGRYIADEVTSRLVAANHLELSEKAAFVTFVETACLMHDIGNPPFGHFGEAAVKKWFDDHGEECIIDAISLNSGSLGSGDPRLIRALHDFREFDGNPQGLRVVSRLQWNKDEYGLNLTTTALASFLKYVRPTGEPPGEHSRKKAGYFSTEAPIVHEVWSTFGYASAQRFPLAYIMEAADDIAYCVSDLEDSFEKGLVHEKDALASVQQRFLDAVPLERRSGSTFEALRTAIEAVIAGRTNDGQEFTYTDFRTSLNRAIVAYSADQYVAKHDEVLAGSLDGLLPRSEAAGAVLEALRTYCQDNVYVHDSIQRTELAGYTAIKGLLENFRPLLQVSHQRFVAALNGKKKDGKNVPIVIESKQLRLFPDKYKKVYDHYVSSLNPVMNEEDRFREWNARAHLVVDYIAGMTDDFAMTTYRTLAGMRL